MRTSALFCSSRLSMEWDLLSRASLATFYCLVPFWGPTSPSSSTITGLFFFKLGIGFNLRSMGIIRGGGGRVVGTWDFGISCKVVPLFLAAISSLKLLFPLFNAIFSSSSSEELSGRAITKVGKWTPECLLVSPSTSEMFTIRAPGFSSSLKWNLSISSYKDI